MCYLMTARGRRRKKKKQREEVCKHTAAEQYHPRRHFYKQTFIMSPTQPVPHARRSNENHIKGRVSGITGNCGAAAWGFIAWVWGTRSHLMLLLFFSRVFLLPLLCVASNGVCWKPPYIEKLSLLLFAVVAEVLEVAVLGGGFISF